MSRHTTMPPRLQKTPHGDVTLTSRWGQGQYYLCARGTLAALEWLFPRMDRSPEVHRSSYRHTFKPAPKPITVERELRRICAVWQDQWGQRLQDHGPSDSNALPEDDGANVSAIGTIGELFDYLHGDRKSTIAKSTHSREVYRLKLWRDHLGDARSLRDLTAKQIASALQEIGGKTSAETANGAFGVLCTYLNWAHHRGLLPHPVHKTVRRLRHHGKPRHQRTWWNTEEVEAALLCAQRDPHQPTATLLVACGCYLGLRVEELIMLRWEDLDLDRTDPSSGRPKPVCHVTPHSGWQPKDGEARDIPICGDLYRILLPHRRHQGFLLLPEKGRMGRPRGRTGWAYRYNPTALWRRLMRELVARGGRAITMYGMRHSFASNLLIRNISDVKVARWMGHRDTRMVHRHYGHLQSYDKDIDVLGVSEETR